MRVRSLVPVFAFAASTAIAQPSTPVEAAPQAQIFTQQCQDSMRRALSEMDNVEVILADGGESVDSFGTKAKTATSNEEMIEVGDLAKSASTELARLRNAMFDLELAMDTAGIWCTP